MNINRHNYEEFFLLYVDKELSAADRKVVEVFVQDNPDLQPELFALQQTVLKADDIILDKKDWLYMEEEITALQENLLLYADDELSAAEKKSVAALLAIDNTAFAEWNILKQTKLQPDLAVVFEDKQSLYKTAGGKVVGFKWWRVAAAAVLLGFGLWSGISLLKNNQATTSTGELVSGTKKQPDKVQTETVSEKEQPQETLPGKDIAATSVQKNNNAAANENKAPEAKNNDQQKNVLPNNNMTVEIKGIKKPDNNLPKSYLENINTKQSNETVVAGVLTENKSSQVVSGNNDAVAKNNQNEKMSNTIVPNRNRINPAAPASMAVTQVVNKIPLGDNNNERYLNVDDDKEKRTVLGGFLRKAKRVLERTTNVKTGEGIKIAGFEIAL